MRHFWAPFRSLWVFSPVPILLTLKGCLATDIGAEEEEEEEEAALCKTELAGAGTAGRGERECSNITAEEARGARPKQESPRPNESCSGGKKETCCFYKCHCLPKQIFRICKGDTFFEVLVFGTLKSTFCTQQ